MYSNEHADYYDTKHYVRVTPHALATPVHVELPKQYGNTDENEDFLFVAVSCYLGDDEFEELLQYKRFESTFQHSHIRGSACRDISVCDSCCFVEATEPAESPAEPKPLVPILR